MNISWGLFSKYKSELYGISIFWIMLFHGLSIKSVALPKSIDLITKILQHSNCGVESFLFGAGIFSV